MKIDSINIVAIDPTDLESMRALMRKYGNDNQPLLLSGQSDEGERQSISIMYNHIDINTYQNNGWIRTNTYWYDGTREESYCR